MIDRPIAIYKDGKLYLDDAGAYEPVSKLRVILMRERMLSGNNEFGNQKARECTEALKQYAAMEEAK
jgi:hypothetical protein